MAILRGLLFHWSAMTWFLGMDTRLRLGRETFERVVHGMDYWHVALMPIDNSHAQHYVFTRV
jgi:hypothetical protein